MQKQPLLTVHDAADFLQVRESTVRALINDKRLRAVKIGKEWRITELDLQAFLDGNANRDPEGAEVAPKDVASGDDEATTEDP